MTIGHTRSALIAVMAGVMVGAADPAHCSVAAQTASSLLPEPISTTRAIQYAERLELDDAQGEFWLDAHARYLDAFFKLRESRVHEFLRETATPIVTSVPTYLPQPRDMRRFTSEHERIMKSMAALEDRWFTESRAVLREDQWQPLESIRLARARQRIMSVMQFSQYATPTIFVDLRGVAAAADLNEDELELIEPDLIAWERSSTVQLKKLPDAVYDMLNRYVDGCIAAGLTPGADDAGGAQLDAFPVRFRVWQSSWDEVRSVARRLVIDHVEAFVRIANKLSPDSGQRFRYARWFVTGGFEELDVRAIRRRESATARLEIALEQNDLTDTERATVEIVQTEFQRRWNAIMDESLLLEAEYRGGIGGKALSETDLNRINVEFSDKSREIMQRRRALAEKVAVRLSGILGEEVAQQIVRAQETERDARQQRRVAEDPDNIFGTDRFLPGADLFLLPPQISRADFDRFARLLRLDEDQTSLAELFFKDYLNGVRRLRRGAFARLREARATWDYSTPPNPTPPPWSAVEANDRARQDVAEGFETLDAALTRDFAAILREDQQESISLVRLHRDLVRFTRFTRVERGRTGRFEFYTESRANLIEAVQDAPIDETARRSALDSVASHAAELAEAARAQYDTMHRYWLAGWRGQIAWAEWQAQGLPMDDYQGHPAQLAYATSTRACNRARRRSIELNRSILASLAFEPDDPVRVRIRAAYLRNAYPHVYEDEEALFAPLHRALDLDDLSPDEAVEIIALLDDVMRKYESICEEMCDLYATSSLQGMYVPGDLEAWDEYQLRNEQAEHLKFTRTEVVSRMLVRLREIIGDERAHQLGIGE